MRKSFIMLLAALGAYSVHAADIELPDLGNPEKRIFSGDKARNIGMAVEGRLR